ncbi:MAG: redox-regulated ATPase YchF [Chloroflexi bacterium]|nr:redox-regulated ATPase YchF [Chloroflexota bacterium]
MSVDIGIVGLAKSGKTTVFNGLTAGKADIHSGTAHIGVAKVPEPRLKTLADMLHPRKVTPAEVRYIDIGASTAGHAKERATARTQQLAQLSNADAIINVARAFIDDSVPHIEGSVNVERDIASMDLELAFSDLAILEKRLERIEESLKGAKAAERQAFLHEQDMLTKLKAQLEKGTPIREMQLTPEEAKAISGYQFLTAKPLLIVANIGENQLAQTKSLETDLNSHYARPKCRVIALCGKLEMELAQLDASEAQEFRKDYSILEPGLDRAIKVSYELLGLISFFTIVSEEIRAWSISKGTPALKAAGKIHSDMERGFIRAEVIGYDDLVKSGTIAEARHKGLLRLEGKTYIVQDGDIITFMFNV